MLKFILLRILQTIPVLLCVATLTFFLARFTPGGPFSAEKQTSPEIRAQLARYYHMNQPLWRQYLAYMTNLCQGDLGLSFKYSGRKVTGLIAESFPVSLSLGLRALAIALLLGLATGLVATLRPHTLTDWLPMSLSMLGVCLPTFVIGPLLALLFALRLGWFNATGWFFERDTVLPALTLGIVYAAYIAQLLRASILEVTALDFIRTARAKGLRPAAVLLRHTLPNALLPVLAFLGPAAAGLLTGSFVTETIFQIPGLGQFFIKSVTNRDYTMILGTVLFYYLLVALFNLIVDILQVLLNPRLAYQ